MRCGLVNSGGVSLLNLSAARSLRGLALPLHRPQAAFGKSAFSRMSPGHRWRDCGTGCVAQGNAERFPALASELVNLPVDVIVSWGTPASLAAHKATDTIPIVMSAGDPIGAGIVAGLARPGRNVTGMSVQMAEQEGKRLELLKKLLPSLSRVAVLSNPSNPYCAIAVGEARRGATALNLQFDLMEASDARSLDAAFLTLSRIRPDAVLVLADPFLAGERVRIADEMIKNKLPSIYSYHEHVRSGGLMTYTKSH
jgi:putative tryptophan/tyrosine transport system substrate-binding protein